MTMLSVPTAVWFPVLTLIMGAILKGVFDYFSDERKFKSEREARKAVERETRKLRRLEIQHAVLIELQDEAGKLVRMTGKINYEDVIASRQGSGWKKSSVSSEANDGFFSANSQVAKLRVRVLDEEIRKLSSDLIDACVKSTLSLDEQAGKVSMLEVSHIAAHLHERIGEILRSLDAT